MMWERYIDELSVTEYITHYILEEKKRADRRL